MPRVPLVLVLLACLAAPALGASRSDPAGDQSLNGAPPAPVCRDASTDIVAFSAAVADGVVAASFVPLDPHADVECLWGYGAATLAATGAALALLRAPLLGIGVVGAGVGALLGFSLGFWGPLIGLLVVLAGVAVPARERRDGILAGTALAAAVLPVPLLMLYLVTGPWPILGVYLVTLAPAVAWFALAVWMRADRRAANKSP